MLNFAVEIKKCLMSINKFTLTYLLFLVTSVLCGCHGSGNVQEDDNLLIIGMDTIDSLRLAITIDSLIALDHDTLTADKELRSYYGEHPTLLWLSREGVTPQADSLMAYLRRVKENGLKASLFATKEIAADRRRIDSLDFTECDVYTAIARMDILLTKSFMRYASGMRYGFCNPNRILNRLDLDKHDTTQTIYRRLYDIPTEVIGKDGYRHLASLAGTDSVSIILQEAEPKSPLYRKLKEMLRKASGEKRRQILVNMERCRWTHPSYPHEKEKYVVVNIPSYELLAVDGDSTLEMRIVCGSRDTKTPLVHSNIMRMDINPRWVMPPSVVKHEVSHHAGDSAYFARHRYHITDRTTGEELNPRHVSAEMLRSGNYRVAQEGGEGNALGRIIFRFDNGFSIFLHDTSSKGTFDRMDRSASHGCIRVQKPYDLACFLLAEKDTTLMGKIQYSMTVSKPKEDTPTTGTDDDNGYDPKRIVHSVKVNPEVPLFITYYTMYLMPDGDVHSYPDVYNYDPAVMRRLKPFVEE